MLDKLNSAGKSTMESAGAFFKAVCTLLFAAAGQFGLFIPLLYGVFGLVLFLVYGAAPFSGVNAALFWSGAGLSLLSAVAVTVRTLSAPKEKSKNSCPYAGEKCFRGARKQAKRPLIYTSTLEPDKLIHEYDDRFVVYETDERGAPHYLRTEYKYR